jgi:2-polyprenyl-3-methyl-5-hydroxy-6-metoxy-1,4-benzoquinol methylase
VARKNPYSMEDAKFDSSRPYYQQEWHEYYTPVIKLVPSDCSVLDIGCGRGGLSEYLRDKKNCQVTGLDISDDSVKICEGKRIKVIKADVEKDNIPGTYDVIILSAVLEHLLDPLSGLETLRDNLNKNGIIIIGVPNFSDILSRIQYFRGKNIKRYGDSREDARLGIQSPGHIQFFNQPSLTHILKKTGYKPIEWSYLKASFSKTPATSPHRMLLRWLIYELYTIDHPLFSTFIAVKSIKI